MLLSLFFLLLSSNVIWGGAFLLQSVTKCLFFLKFLAESMRFEMGALRKWCLPHKFVHTLAIRDSLHVNLQLRRWFFVLKRRADIGRLRAAILVRSERYVLSSLSVCTAAHIRCIDTRIQV